MSGETASHETVVLANGHQINRFDQTRPLPVYAVGGQVSHIPTTPRSLGVASGVMLRRLSDAAKIRIISSTVLAPAITGVTKAPSGAKKISVRTDSVCLTVFRMRNGATEVDVSGNSARCGVRCATRDHLPMVGNVPDYHATLTHYADLADNKTSAAPAPVYPGLFMLGALGSRGLCSAPLCAEILAAQMSNEPIPLDAGTLAALNPNRLWVRKLLKGKAVK